MSVIIKGMDMPKCCADCYVDEYALCGNLWAEVDVDKERHKDCPLVEIPTPHGRLIDGDALMKTYEEENWMGYYCIGTAPTILEAED